ncbi:LmeA family phospholipid-binding protein [Cellulomonas soli]|uniref:LmeA family phospholipid-binding protein n=1 Tax=Cellulomonas soli TaxID=931535 RepID=UPI003F866E43
MHSTRSTRRPARLLAGAAVVAVVVVLVVAELLARAVVGARVASAVERSSVLSGQEVSDLHVGFGPWPVLPWLVVGRVRSVTVGADQVTWQGVPVGVEVHLADLQLHGTPAAARTSVRVTVPGEGLAGLVEQVLDESDPSAAPGPFGDATWSVRDGMLVAQAQVARRGISLPVEVAVVVSAADGALQLRPAAVTVAGLVLDVSAVAGTDGPLAALAETRTLTPDLPGDLTLTSAAVVGDRLVLEAQQTTSDRG